MRRVNLKLNQDQRAFTLVELMLSMAFFSFILVFFTVGFVQINRTFNRGVTIKKVTETGRAVIEDVSRSIRLAGPSDVTVSTAPNRLCIGDVRYGWNIPSPPGPIPETLDGTPGGEVFTLVKSEVPYSNCNDVFGSADVQNITRDGDDFFTQGVTSLLDEGIIVQNMTVQQVYGDRAVKIDLTLSTADLVDANVGQADARCDGFVDASDHFCDVVRFTTTVNHRVLN